MQIASPTSEETGISQPDVVLALREPFEAGGLPPVDPGWPFSSPALQALAGFANSTVPALLILALLEAERQDKVQPALRQLAFTLHELQAAVKDGSIGPVISGAALRRLYATVCTLGVDGD